MKNDTAGKRFYVKIPKINFRPITASKNTVFDYILKIIVD